jgi:hypothetical protein
MLLRLLFSTVLALVAVAATAHDPGLSEIELSVAAGRVEASWWIDPADLAGSEPAAEGALRLELDGTAAEPSFADARATWDGHRRLRLAWNGAPGSVRRLRASLLERLPLGHRVLVRVLSPDGRPRAEHLLDARAPTLELSEG